MRLENKVVVVTGASSGMGHAMGSAEDIANAALFLASDESGYVNGIVITVDGGWTCL